MPMVKLYFRDVIFVGSGFWKLTGSREYDNLIVYN